jgi:hypothetical protein
MPLTGTSEVLALKEKLDETSMTPSSKSVIRRFLDKAGKEHLSSGTFAMAEVVESAVVGLGAAFVEQKRTGGLDYQFGNSTVPLDGAAALLLLGGSVYMAGDGSSHIMRGIGGKVATLFFHREATNKQWFSQGGGGTAPAKASGEDPILAQARRVGFPG